MANQRNRSRREFVKFGAAAAAYGMVPRVLAQTTGGNERSKLILGLPVNAASFTPIYVAAARTWKENGLDIQLTSFRGDAEAAQALAGDSIQVSVQSLDALMSLLNAGQPVSAFYAGFYQSDFAWYAQPSIKNWAGLKGSSVGISTFGSLTANLTAYALRRAGLEAMKDVQLVQTGPVSSGFQAMRAGRIGAAILSPPFKWSAAEAGFSLIGTQAKDVAPRWPKHVFIAKTKFLDENPNTVRSLLRAHVAAIRYARANRAFTAQVLGERLKYQTSYAERAFEEMMPGYNERGTLPDAADMDVFWKVQMLSGDIKAPWPNEKLLDGRFIRTFDSWAPKA